MSSPLASGSGPFSGMSFSGGSGDFTEPDLLDVDLPSSCDLCDRLDVDR